MDRLPSTETETQLVSACRTAIGDRLRSITCFTHDDYVQVYLRNDLERDADLGRFADHESRGFAARSAYRGSELGSYLYTIRGFEDGYVTRLVTDEYGVFVTTDSLTMNRFEEVVAAVRSVVGEAANTS